MSQSNSRGKIDVGLAFQSVQSTVTRVVAKAAGTCRGACSHPGRSHLRGLPASHQLPLVKPSSERFHNLLKEHRRGASSITARMPVRHFTLEP